MLMRSAGAGGEISDHRHFCLLRPRRRPSARRGACQADDEFTAPNLHVYRRVQLKIRSLNRPPPALSQGAAVEP